MDLPRVSEASHAAHNKEMAVILNRVARCARAAFCVVVAVALPAAAQVWQDLGPGRILGYVQVGGASGRVSAIAGHPSDPNTYYLGGADGGVWKTTNDGQSWAPLTDAMPTNSIGCITIDPTNPNRIYVGTGEANRAFHCRYGLGIYRSDDGGATWAHLPRSGGVHVAATFDGRCIGRICVNPSNANKLFAAVTWSVGDRHDKRHLYGENPRGLYTSSDAGETWTHVNLPGTTTDWGCTDVVHVSGGLVFLAAVWDDVNYPYTTARLYLTSDAGVTWTQVGSGFQNRMAIAVAPGGSIVWALDSLGYPDYKRRLWRSADVGQTWSQTYIQGTQPSTHVFEAMVLTANPGDANKVYFGGTYGPYAGTDDVRRFVYDPGGNHQVSDIGPSHEDTRSAGWRSDGRLLIGNDGGIDVTDSADTAQTWIPTWTDRNKESLGITQIVPGFCVHPTDSNLIFAGTQDNSDVRRTDLTRVWHHTIGGGDGGANAIDSDGPVPGGSGYQVYAWPFSGSGGMNWSSDNGDTWHFASYPDAAIRRLTQLVVDVTYPSIGSSLNPLFVAAKPVQVGTWSPLNPT